jgi:hypothetical protein
MRQKRVSFCCAGLIPRTLLMGVLVLVIALVGCKSSQAAPTAVSTSLWSTYSSQTLIMSYPGALDAADQLMLGILRLEGTENAFTSEQAVALLPVVQALQGRVLQSDAERDATLTYVEAHLTPTQLAAIAAMHLTQDDLSAWTQDIGRGAGYGPGQGGPGLQGTPGAPPSSGGAFPGGRATFPAAGTRPAQFGRGTPQARGTSRGTSSGVGTGSGQDTVLLNALIRLLAQKSGSAAPSPANRTITRTPAPVATSSP